MKTDTHRGGMAGRLLTFLMGSLMLPLSIALAGLSQAATTTPLRHTVRPGQTLYSIARSYGVPVSGLATANGIRDPARLRAGTRLVIPSANATVAVARQKTTSNRTTSSRATPGRTTPSPTTPGRTTPARTTSRRVARPSGPPSIPPAVQLDDADEPGANSADVPARLSPAMSPSVADLPGRFDRLPWPVAGRVISGFDRPRPGHRHQGIDIGSDAGTPIHPVAEGTVVQVEEHYGKYGRLIAIEHDNGMVSYYGHNMKNLVVQGQRVTTDDVIALVGHSGNASCNHLHFEIRSNGAAIDPATALSPQR